MTCEYKDGEIAEYELDNDLLVEKERYSFVGTEIFSVYQNSGILDLVDFTCCSSMLKSQ